MPHLIIIGGPNGSGKTTTAPNLLRDRLAVVDYVNADIIAQGLSGFKPEKASLQAGRIMLKRIQELAEEQANFSFETTLASRTFTNLIKELKQNGYFFHLIFLWLQDAEIAVSRVAARVKMGGHLVQETTIRRRYQTGLSNFFSLYKPLADTWQIYDNSNLQQLKPIASGSNHTHQSHILNEQIWHKLEETYYAK